MSDAVERVLSGRTWEEFCDTLKSAGQVILRTEAPQTEIDRAEGWRYLTRLMRVGCEMMVESGDTDFPTFYCPSHTTVKIGGDNPDNLYLNATIDGRREYRIRGTRGTVHYLSFGTRANRLAIDGTMTETGNLATTELQTDADGSFEVILSQERKGRNWVRITEQSNVVLVRQTCLDRKREEPAQLTIECLDGPARPAPLTAETLDRRLMSVARFVNGTAKTFADWVQLFKQRPNELPARDQAMFQKVGGDPSIHYVHGYWQLAPDEALVIDAEIPRCKFWNIQVDNYWMESMDYRYLPAHLNAHTASRNADGTVRIVIAHENPGVPNFLTTAGHREGSMLLRWVDADRHPTPECRVVKTASLKSTAAKTASGARA
jgi:hypothetical protein